MTANGERRHGTSTREAGALQQADLFGERHVRVLVGPRFVDAPSPRAAAERLSEMREPDVEIARESARGRGRCAVAVDQDAAGTKGAVAATIERQLRAGRPDVMQRVARDDGIAGAAAPRPGNCPLSSSRGVTGDRGACARSPSCPGRHRCPRRARPARDSRHARASAPVPMPRSTTVRTGRAA